MNPVGFDLETAPADELFSAGDSFVKLCGYTDGEKPAFTEDPQEMIRILEKAPWIYGHNIMCFDLLSLCHSYGADWEKLSAKAVDTMILARLDWPPQARDVGGSEDKYSLDAVCERNKVPGKTGDLKEIAKKHGGMDNIPVDDAEYLDYLAGDIRAIQG